MNFSFCVKSIAASCSDTFNGTECSLESALQSNNLAWGWHALIHKAPLLFFFCMGRQLKVGCHSLLWIILAFFWLLCLRSARFSGVQMCSKVFYWSVGSDVALAQRWHGSLTGVGLTMCYDVQYGASGINKPVELWAFSFKNTLISRCEAIWFYLFPVKKAFTFYVLQRNYLTLTLIFNLSFQHFKTICLTYNKP